MNSIQIDEVKKLQENYKSILLSITERLKDVDISVVIDEVNIFWYKNRKFVKNILNFAFEPYNTYIFTAATTMGTQDNEHYPFLILGKYHIWDDPVCNYFQFLSKSFDKQFEDELKKEIHNTIYDNIEIINNLGDKIVILPVRFLFDNTDQIHDIGMRSFLSMFKKEMNFQTYKESISSIEDVKNELKSGFEKVFIFSNEDDIGYELEKRFYLYKENYPQPLGSDASDAMIFWICVYGYICQAIGIILLCLDFKLVPYIRNRVNLVYLSIIQMSIFGQSSEELSSLMLKSTISYMVHKSFDHEKSNNLSLDVFLREISEYGLEKKVLSETVNHQLPIVIDYTLLDKLVEDNVNELIDRCIVKN